MKPAKHMSGGYGQGTVPALLGGNSAKTFPIHQNFDDSGFLLLRSRHEPAGDSTATHVRKAHGSLQW